MKEEFLCFGPKIFAVCEREQAAVDVVVVTVPKLGAYAYLGQEKGFIANAVDKTPLSAPMGERIILRNAETTFEGVRRSFA